MSSSSKEVGTGKMASPFVEKLLTGEWSPERFRRHLEEIGAPLDERVTVGEVEVTFVDELETTRRSPSSSSPQDGLQLDRSEFTSVSGTPFRVLTLRMRSDRAFVCVQTS